MDRAGVDDGRYVDPGNVFQGLNRVEGYLVLSADQWAEICNHLQKQIPDEACGLIGGHDSKAEIVIPVTNELHSPVRFHMAPQEQLDAFIKLEKNEMDLIAIFHSHPAGPPHPSKTDIADFFYPDVVTLICYPSDNNWIGRAYKIEGNQYFEIPLVINDE
jgi:proteasome lid subunit RPN8/RPN11